MFLFDNCRKHSYPIIRRVFRPLAGVMFLFGRFPPLNPHFLHCFPSPCGGYVSFRYIWSIKETCRCSFPSPCGGYVSFPPSANLLMIVKTPFPSPCGGYVSFHKMARCTEQKTRTFPSPCGGYVSFPCLCNSAFHLALYIMFRRRWLLCCPSYKKHFQKASHSAYTL